MSDIKYRPEVDGLRALAVLGVIIFHFGLGLPGGYVGVDVFFVISGYLITGIIVRETEEKRFSMKRFWIRRIRRILPAAAFLVLSCLVAGYFLLENFAFVALGKSGIAYALMLSNVYFWKASDSYFAESGELMPLLHTWSLSVEEQFYVIYPIVMFLLLRRGRKTAITGIAVIALVSLALSIYGVANRPSATFFLLPMRAWELVAGGFLVLVGGHNRFAPAARELLAWGGIAMIVAAMLFYSAVTPFPGTAALLPVGGAALFIFANQGKLTSAGRFFALRPLVFIGLLSYSLYLWHWPIMAFAKHILIESTPVTITIQLVLVALLSYFSWRFIETPFRRPGRLTKPLPAFSFGIAATLSVVALSVVIVIQKGFPQRFNSHLQTIIEDIYWSGDEYVSNETNGIPIGSIAPENTLVDFVLWGDSHGMSVADLIDEAAKKEGLSARALLRSAFPPVPGSFESNTRKANLNPAILAQAQERLEWIISSNVKNLILVARWDAMIEGPLKTEMTSASKSAYSTKEREERAVSLERRLSKMLSVLAENGVNVWIIQQVPSASRPHVARDFYIATAFSGINATELNSDTPLAEYESIRRRSNDVFQKLDFPNLTLIDPLSLFYPEGDNLQIHSDRAFYRDEDHLTKEGARHYLTETFQKVMKQISQKREVAGL